jgi:hypothetical protein
MKREKIERLKELWDDAWNVVRNEWGFGDFKEQLDAKEKEAKEIFADLLREAD